MLDKFNREINYLRISITDRCNLRCVYCMPESGIRLKTRADILSYEQIEKIVQAAVKLGVTKVRLTGGEPLERRSVEKLVERLSGIAGLYELCLTTNGTRLSEMALKLKMNGLHRVNISMDTMNPNRYRELTRGGDLRAVFAGIDAALDAGLTPIKVNMVMLEDTTPTEIEQVHAFCKQKSLQLQKIVRFSLRDRQDLNAGFHAERPPQCSACNKLRLTADGFLKPCLFSENEIRVDFDDIQGSWLKAVALKPASGSSCRNRSMSQIGG